MLILHSRILCFVDRASLYNLVNRTNLVHNFLNILIVFSTFFRQLFAHYQEKIPYLCDTQYLSLYIDDCLVCRAELIPPCIPDSHLYRLTNTRCRTGTVFSPDNGHIIARKMQRKTLNILIHCGRVTQICVFTLQLCRTGDADLHF